jgi:hypothetical protein
MHAAMARAVEQRRRTSSAASLGTHHQAVLRFAVLSVTSLPSNVHLSVPGDISGLPCGKQLEALAAQREESTHQAPCRQYNGIKVFKALAIVEFQLVWPCPSRARLSAALLPVLVQSHRALRGAARRRLLR